MARSEIDIEATDDERNAKCSANHYLSYLTYSVIWSLVYIGVATHFYNTLLDVEALTNCTSTLTTPYRDVDNFCEHLRTWKLCGFYGIFLPGCAVLISGSFLLFTDKDSQANFQDWSQMFDCLFSMTKTLNAIVLITLWMSNVASTHITGSHGLGIAAKLYMAFLGLELGIVAVILVMCVCFLIT